MQKQTRDSETTIDFLNHLPASHNSFSNELATIFHWVTFSVMCQVVCVFGVGSNIINIICFVKQGFKDPVNVSFLGLAVADVCSLLTIIFSNLCLTPAFTTAELPFEPLEFQHLIGGIPHTAFTRISSWITALITMERCLCIIAPLRVKSIVTPKRVFLIIVGVFFILMANMTPIYVVTKLQWRFFPSRNKTLIGMVFARNRESVKKVSYLINNVCVPFIAFTTIIICTVVLVVQLRKKTKWRQTSTASAQADNVSARNQKVSKMVVMISVLFICCFTPLCALFIGMSVEPEFTLLGKHRNILSIIAGFALLLELINSSANIFIYYDMSSKYRAVLRELLCMKPQNK